MHIQNTSLKAISRGFPYLGRGCIVVLAMGLIASAELSVATSWSAASSVTPSMEAVNRTHKGDRLLPTAIRRNTPSFRLERPVELPVGCESVVSSVDRSPMAHMARHCLS